jgi:peptide/nickel transport system substrate-binding protein
MCVERRFFLKAIIVIVAFGFVCNFVKPGLIQASSGKTITIAQGVDMTSWDPHGRATTSALAMWYHMYERLVKQDVIKGTYIPLLAESWTGEGTVWTFKLRKGVKFHNGAEFTANDVKFTIEHALKAPMGARLRGIKGAEVVDKHTVKIITHKPHSPLLGLVRFVVILSEQHFKENGKDALKKPVGTGPFQFVKWVKGSHFIAKKNPAYWGKPAQIDQIIWRPIPEDAARITALETGAVDLATNIPSHDLARLESKPNLSISSPIRAALLYLNSKSGWVWYSISSPSDSLSLP